MLNLQKKGYTSASQLKTDLQWHEERVNYVLVSHVSYRHFMYNW